MKQGKWTTKKWLRKTDEKSYQQIGKQNKKELNGSFKIIKPDLLVSFLSYENINVFVENLTCQQLHSLASSKYLKSLGSISIFLKLNLWLNLLQEAEANGEDYDRLKLLEVTADDAEKLDKRRKRKKNADVGFSGKKHLDSLLLLWECLNAMICVW